MGRRVKIKLEGFGELQPDGTMHVIGVLAVDEDLPLPGLVPNLRVTTLADDEVILEWDAAPYATSYEITREGSPLGSGAPLTITDGTVVAGTEYTYAVRGVNATGNGDYAELLVSVPDGGLQVPDAPVLVLQEITSRSITFNWAPLPTAAAYRVYDDVTLLATQAGTSFEHTGLDPSTAHEYEVIAENAAGDSAASNTLNVSTADNTAPVWGISGPFTALVGESLNINLFQLCEDAEGEIPTFTVVSGALPPGAALVDGFIIGTLTAAGSFEVGIEADDGFDTAIALLSFEVANTVDLIGPTAPVLGTPVVTGSQVSVPLSIPSDDASGILKYNIQRRLLPDGVFAFRGSLTAASDFPYIETGVPVGSYEYRCRAQDNSPAQNFGEYSAAVTAIVEATAPNPDVPVNFTAIKSDATTVQLSWEPGPSGAAPTGYDLEYSIEANGGSSTGPWSDFVISGTTTSATHSALPTGRVWYRLRALGAAGNSGYTTVIFVDIGESVAPADFEITGGTSWNGATLRVPLTGGPARAVQPGDIIEMDAGTYRGFTFLNIIGTLANPVVIRVPSTGQVLFRNLNRSANGFLVKEENCHGVVYDGFTTDPGVPVERGNKRYGFKCMYAQNAVQGGTDAQKEGLTAYVKHKGSSTSGAPPYNVSDKCTHRYWHIDGGWDLNPAQSYSITGAGGIGFDSNDNQYNRDDFVVPGPGNPTGYTPYTGVWQESMIWEHILCENLGGEPTYFGGNPYAASRAGQEPHIPLRYIKLRHFYFYNSAGQAIQMKSVFGGQGGADAATDNSIHDGVIIKSTQVIDGATNGTPAIVLNSSKVDVFNVWIEQCGANCMAVNVSEGTNVNFPDASTTFRSRIYNCVMVDNATVGAYNGIRVASYTGSGGGGLPAAYKPIVHIFCNTILRHSASQPSIDYTNTGGAAGTIRNNLIVGSGDINFGPTTDDGSNIENTLTQAAVFVDPTGSLEAGTIDLHLLQARAAAGGTVAPAGTQPAGWAAGVGVPNFDFEGVPGDNSRTSSSPDCGAYEF